MTYLEWICCQDNRYKPGMPWETHEYSLGLWSLRVKEPSTSTLLPGMLMTPFSLYPRMSLEPPSWFSVPPLIILAPHAFFPLPRSSCLQCSFLPELFELGFTLPRVKKPDNEMKFQCTCVGRGRSQQKPLSSALCPARGHTPSSALLPPTACKYPNSESLPAPSHPWR